MGSIISFSKDVWANEIQKERIIEKTIPEIKTVVKDVYMVTLLEAPQIHVEAFEAILLPRIVKALETNLKILSVDDLKNISEFLSSKDYAQRRKIVNKFPNIIKKLTSLMTEDEFIPFPKNQNISSAYYKTIKDYANSLGFESKISQMFDILIKSKPSLVKGLNTNQIEEKRLKFAEKMYDFFALEISALQDEGSFTRCMDFEQSKAWNQFLKIVSGTCARVETALEEELDKTEKKE